MTPLSSAILVNLLGFLTGSVLYGMLLVMAFQTLHPGRSRAASEGSASASQLPAFSHSLSRAVVERGVPFGLTA